MSLRNRIVQSVKAQTMLPVSYSYPTTLPLNNGIQMIGNEIALYPADSGERYIAKGYKMNDAVYSVCSTNAEKAAQLRLYHIKVKLNEKKTLQEYQVLQKGFIGEREAKELNRMRKSMVEDYVVNSPLSKLLNKPNRNQTQSEWIENIFLNWDLQGEGNIWFARLDPKAPPVEMMIIPRQHLQLIGDGQDPYRIVAYQFQMNGTNYRWDKNDVLMWKHTNPVSITTTLDHLRGMAPLESFMIPLQGMNEADLRVATSNKNAGANGFAYRTDLKTEPDLIQKQDMRRQFDSLVNSSEMINKIAILGGEWGYYNIGQSFRDQQLLEQYGISFKRICRIFHTPSQIFDEGNSTYDNQKRADRRWIFSKIAPSMYQLKGMLSEKLIKEFNLDPETNLVDCDIMSLPEMSEDLKDLVAAVKDATWLSQNEKRSATGYEPINEGKYDVVPVDPDTLDLGADLSGDIDLLDE